MKDKNTKENAPWNHDTLINLEDHQNIFRNLFESGQFGLAMSDERGNVILRNPIFVTDILDGAGINLAKITSQTEGAKVVSDDLLEFTIHSNLEIVKLVRMNLPKKPDGSAYLWLSYRSEDSGNKQIRNVQNLYRSFVDSNFALVFRTSKDDELLFSNRLFITSLALEAARKEERFIVRNLFEDPVAYDTFKERVIIEKKIFNETIYFKKINGKRLTGLVNCQLHNDERGNPVFSWIVLDISERFEYEQDLQTKNDQLAKVNNQMERFLYSASHDLRSPLTSILGLVNLLRLETKEKAILEYVNKIENCTFKLDNIIKDLMSFSKSNYQRIKSEKIDFETTIWKVINSHRTVADFKKISFEVRLMGDVPFYCDQERVEIILDHLIRNSIIFYDANKVKPIVRINGNISPQEIMLEIIDNGIGISGHHLSNVFSMFYKASDRSKGAGLGLYIVKENVQQLKGTIQVESEIGFGSVLRIIIPNDAKGRLINRKLQLQAGLPSFSM